MPNFAEALNQAVQLHQAGRLQAAEQAYRQILATDPKNVNALHLLGAALHQQGQHAAAVDYIRQAIAIRAKEPSFYNNLGEAYRALGRWDEAIDAYRRATQLNPDYAEAYNNQGIAWQDQGKPDRAARCFEQAVKRKPDYAQAHYNLGNAWREQDKPHRAVVCYQRAVQLMPQYAEAHNNLGLAWRAMGETHRAVQSYQRALELRPDFAATYNNLGVAWQDLGHPDQAVACYEQAVQREPGYAEAYNNLGTAWKESGKLDSAVACFQRALQLMPDFAEAHHNLGNTLRELGRLDEAIESFRWAVHYRPDYPAALGALIHQLQHVCAWDELPTLLPQAVETVQANRPADAAGPEPIHPFTFLTLATPTTAAQQLRCARTWAERHLRSPASAVTKAPAAQAGPAQPKSKTSSKITLGYLSADFHAHATACLLSELIERHDRTRFAVHAYSYGPDDGSAMRQRLVAAFDRFVDVRDLSFTEAAQRIAQDGVDILIDLKGYTADARPQIAAQRPAPIQVNYLGYPGTMGAAFIDYILVDDFIVPADQQPHFSERLVHLPGCYQVNDSRREIAAHVPTRAEAGLPAEGFVFCSFNNSYKITPALFDVWMRLLNAVPGSVLWLLEGNRFVAQNLRREAAARGIPAERLVFAPKLPLPDHLARHRLADLFLDTFPVVAHTTASDALWAGCPLLTLAGETFVSRVAGSLLRALGLPELIATTWEQYEQTALRLAQDPEALTALRQRLENQRETSGLFDGARFARDLEQAYQRMWETRAADANLPSPACGRGAGGEGGRK